MILNSDVKQLSELIQKINKEIDESSKANSSNEFLASKKSLFDNLDLIQANLNFNMESGLFNDLISQLTEMLNELSNSMKSNTYTHFFELNQALSSLLSVKITQRNYNLFDGTDNLSKKVIVLKENLDGFISSHKKQYSQKFIDLKDRLIENVGLAVSVLNQTKTTKEFLIEFNKIIVDCIETTEINKPPNAAYLELNFNKPNIIYEDITIDDLINRLVELSEKLDSLLVDFGYKNSSIENIKEIKELVKLLDQKKGEVNELLNLMKKNHEDDQQVAIKQRENIDKILKNATNAGLSGAFNKSRSSMRTRGLLNSFISNSLFLLIFFIMLSFYYPVLFDYIAFNGTTALRKILNDSLVNNDSFYIQMLQRVSLIAPLVWMASNAAFKSGQYFRLEQEYTHKYAVSMSFEGYKAQSKELDSQSDNKEMLNRLLKTAIDTIGKNPAKASDKIKGNKAALELMNEQLNTTLEQFSKFKDLVSSEQSSKEKDTDKN